MYLGIPQVKTYLDYDGDMNSKWAIKAVSRKSQMKGHIYYVSMLVM